MTDAGPVPWHAADDRWMVDAACRGRPGAWWFPIPRSRVGRGRIYDYSLARAVCHACPVVAECRTYILAAEGRRSLPQRHGMWGGLTPEDRHVLMGGRLSTAAQRSRVT